MKKNTKHLSNGTENYLSIWKNEEKKIDFQPVEIVERKGVGHPDTICDILAERISQEYSKYCIQEFGTILRHMVDKIAILGGKSKVVFGGGEMEKPIRLLLNCRFTKNVGNKEIPYLSICKNTIYGFFEEIMPGFDAKKWITIIDNVHFSQGPGVVYESDGKTNNERDNFFNVPQVKYLQFHDNNVRSNDTSTAVAYAPYSSLEKIVLFIENKLNSKEFKKKNNYVGTDIKIMAVRDHKKLFITACIPFISKKTPSLQFYQDKKIELSEIIKKDVKKFSKDSVIEVFVNTRDSVDGSDLYLTLTGSAVESGDEGVVGRGNRYNGLISFSRRMSMEACCGKNPVYHVGKVYTACSKLIAEKIYKKIATECVVSMTSQMGRPLAEPLIVSVELTTKKISNKQKQIISIIVKEVLDNFEKITNDIICGKIMLY